MKLLKPYQKNKYMNKTNKQLIRRKRSVRAHNILSNNIKKNLKGFYTATRSGLTRVKYGR